MNQVKRYLGYTFGLSWISWGIIVIANQFGFLQIGTLQSMLFLIPGGISPAISIILIKKKYCTKDEYISFMKNIINPKYHILEYILIIGLAFVYCFLPMLFGGATKEAPIYYAIFMFPIMILGGGLEEIGWRGFLQPTLQKKFSSFISTVIVAIIWAVWHLPLWFIQGSNQSSWNFLYFFIIVMALSFLLSVIHSATKSIFLCIIFHAFINSFWEVFVPNDKLLPAFITLVFAIVIFLTFESIVKKNRKESVYL